ncbi:MAG: hypothetical protein JSR77_13265 [Planctomycetes bacterium]|nr:hypothetical protein [Planctomycetota bacterium]
MTTRIQSRCCMNDSHKPRRFRMSGAALGVICLAAAASVGGCGGAPTGNGHGRIATGGSTRGEEHAPGPLISQVAEATDQASQFLATELDRIAVDENGGHQGWMLMGSMENLSMGLLPTSELEMARDRLVGKLQNSDLFYRNFTIVSNRAEREAALREEAGPPADLLGMGGAGGPARPDPQFTYRLSSKMGVIERGTTRMYAFQFRLNRLSDGVQVWADRYETVREGGQRPKPAAPPPAPAPAPGAPPIQTPRNAPPAGPTLDDVGDAIGVASDAQGLIKGKR